MNEMCALKDEFQENVESSNSWFDGLVKRRDWLKLAVNLFPKSQGTVRRWLVEITAYFESKTSYGVVEGVNQKIKLIKRAGFGFRNQENFELRSLLNFIDQQFVNKPSTEEPLWYFDKNSIKMEIVN